MAGDEQTSNFAVYDPNSDTWSATGNGVDGTVGALAQNADGRIYLSGTFANAGGLSADRVASYDPKTATFASLGSGVSGPSMR